MTEFRCQRQKYIIHVGPLNCYMFVSTRSPRLATQIIIIDPLDGFPGGFASIALGKAHSRLYDKLTYHIKVSAIMWDAARFELAIINQAGL